MHLLVFTMFVFGYFLIIWYRTYSHCPFERNNPWHIKLKSLYSYKHHAMEVYRVADVRKTPYFRTRGDE
jgi:hypothetical protein